MKIRDAARAAELSPDAQVRYRGAAAAVLGPVTVVVAVFYALLAVSHLLVLEGRTAQIMSATAALTALAIGGLSAWWYRLRHGLRLANLLLTGVLVLAFANSGLHLYLTGQVIQTTNFMLVIIACGLGLMSTPWNVAVTAIGWLTWAVALLGVGTLNATHWIFTMLMATFVGQLARYSRRRSLDTAAAAYGQIEELSLRDPLTGLTNRRGLQLRGSDLVAVARHTSRGVYCAFIDVDGLKEVNDVHGHDAGDTVLITVAEALGASFSGSEVVARWGGDEFAIVALGPCPGRDEVAAQLDEAVRRHSQIPESVWPAQLSVGIGRLEPGADGDLDSLLAAADQDMYHHRRVDRQT
ncbi:MAG: GGDEF domain-containing protein [Actinobacteria bacterium]|nr:GGDEF domain-containing protein [Actinomycetota bacterium]MCB9413267.1 GGDEF domain-containing protein [Actinomycetota bacterium]